MASGTAVYVQPWIGLAMLGVIPCSVAITVWQLISQKRVRLTLLRGTRKMDGTEPRSSCSAGWITSGWPTPASRR